MSELTFIVLGEAVPKGRARAFRTAKGIRFHTPPRTADYEQQVRVLAQEAIEARSPEEVSAYPLRGAVALEVIVLRAPPKSLSKKKRLAAVNGTLRPTTRPDLDNIVKCIKDALNEVAWQDDSQIVALHASKQYAEQPRCIIKVRSLEA